MLAEVDLSIEAFKSLMASGPVAIVLIIIVTKLWNKLEAKEKELKASNEKTLRLAVRVQRCVEELAGIKKDTVIDEDDDEEDEKRKSRYDEED